MRLLLPFLIFFVTAMATNQKKPIAQSLKESINKGANGIDSETRKIIRSGKKALKK